MKTLHGCKLGSCFYDLSAKKWVKNLSKVGRIKE
jgi:hypothetical protein